MQKSDPLLHSMDELRESMEPGEIDTLAEIIDQTYSVRTIHPFDEEDVTGWFEEPADPGPVGRSVDRVLDAAFGDDTDEDYPFTDRRQEHALEQGFQLAIEHPRPDWGHKGFRSEIDALGRGFHNLGVTSSYKATYVDEDEEYIMHIPRDGTTMDERLEEVLTWEHNAETIRKEGVEPVTEYEVAVIELDDQPYPVLLGEYRKVEREREMGEEDIQRHEETLQQYEQTMVQLAEDGDIACHHPREYRRDSNTSEYALDVEQDEIVVLDIGELALSGRERERFLEDTGISDRVTAYTEQG